MGRFVKVAPLALGLLGWSATGWATPVQGGAEGGEASIVLPNLHSVSFFGIDGWTLLLFGLLFCLAGLWFALAILGQLKRLPVHKSMSEVSELIWQTCKTYLFTQGRFILILEGFIGVVILLYFGLLLRYAPEKVAIILVFSVIGIAGSYGVAWFGIRVNTYANSRMSFAALKGRPLPLHVIPVKAGMSIGMLLISVELFMMLCILLFIPADYAGACFIGFAIGESMAAAVLRIAGGIFTKIADIGSDLMKIVFNIKEDDARNPGVIADCTGDNAGDSVGPSADGFETYGVTGVALIVFILIAVHDPVVQVQLLVWIFVMRIVMLVASALAYTINGQITRARYRDAADMDFEAPLTSLVWITSVVSVALTYFVSWLLIGGLGDGTMWWKLSTIITCGTLAGAIIPELVKVFTSTESRHVREILNSAREGGASLGILSGFVAGNFSALWLGLSILLLMSIGYLVSLLGLSALMLAPAVFAFGLVAFGFLAMGPVTIAVDSYGPVADNAQSVYELSVIEQIPGVEAEIKKDFGFDVDFARAKHLLEENDGAGQHLQGDRQAGADRHGGGGRDDDDLLDCRPAHRRAHREHREDVDPARTVPARPDRRRLRHLLVHRRVDAGRDHRRLPGGRVHQGQHPTRGRDQGVGDRQQARGGDLHPVRAEGHAQHLHRGVLRHAGLLLPRAVLLHRLPHLDRALRPVPGDLHGQRRRRLGQRQEDRRGGAAAEGHRAPRRDGHWRYRG